ncbi:hypothetical protein Baya_14174 [Bagarius yarrelli]|uniref:Uncharacterized protein n=1 Tax=Bagarius yarrelli TaxID=175774 RepID=A0A556V820_BAGYA|nr:hypothetical protein Baya_14174 [Bagarius yarrelli]
MSRTWNYVEQLWQRVDKVYDLRDEEKQHGFAEMTEDSDHSEGHASEVTEGVAYKHGRRVPDGKREPNNEDCGTVKAARFLRVLYENAMYAAVCNETK